MKNSDRYINRVLCLVLALSLMFNIYTVIKTFFDKGKTNNTDIIYDSINIEVVEKANNIILASGSEQYPNDLLSYLLIVNDHGKITNAYCLDGNYEAIAFNEQTEELYLLSKKGIMKIGKTISNVTQQNENLSKQYSSDIYMVENKLYVRSSVVKDERLDFKPVKGYSGYLDVSSIGTDLHMIPIGIVVKY